MDCCSPQLMGDAIELDALLFFTTGLVISLGHCIGMCGPLVTAFSLAQREEGRSTWSMLPVLLLYHTGRLTSYALIGLVFGLVGSATRLIAQGPALQGILSLLVGFLMLLLGFGLLGWLPTQRWVESNSLGQLVAERSAGLLRTRRAGGRFLLGMANGLLPCGPVYAMALGTVASAQPTLGAGAMALYGLGTLPVLLAVGLGAGRLAPAVQNRFNRMGAFLVLIIGVQLLLRGAAALGWIEHLKFGELVIW